MDESAVDEFLEHFGVKGMHWGVRKEHSPAPALTGLGPDKIVRKLSNGDTLTLSRVPPNAIIKSLARVSKNYRDSYNNGANFSVHDTNGKSIGSAQVWKKNDKELYLNWISIKPSARGQGYATATLKAAEQFGKKQGFEKMTLEVPGNAPDARHIYENLGFKVVREATPAEMRRDTLWGGLTSMEYQFKK